MSEDNWYFYFYDMIKGFDWFGDQDVIEFMCCEVLNVVYEFEYFGMLFDCNVDGMIYQCLFGGYIVNYGEKLVQCVCVVVDCIGYVLLYMLYQQNVEVKMQFFVEWMVFDLICDVDGDVFGVMVFEMEMGDVYIMEGKMMLFVMGGVGWIFVVLINVFINIGDGFGMVVCLGIVLQDMEFWQFYLIGVVGVGVLIIEGVCGEGGILCNVNGECFMECYVLMLKDLVLCDFVLCLMDQEIKEGCGVGLNKDYVLFDLLYIGVEMIMKCLLLICEIVLKFVNVDVIKELILVVLMIYYQMGGILINIYGQVVGMLCGYKDLVNGFYVVGECLCVFVYGVNCFGMNLLLDFVVFGCVVGNYIVEYVKNQKEYKLLLVDVGEFLLVCFVKFDKLMLGEYMQDVVNDICLMMQKYVGVFCMLELLKEGVDQMVGLKVCVENIYLKDKLKVFNIVCVEVFELENLIEVVCVMMVLVEVCKESCGVYVYSDYEYCDDENWLCYMLWYSEGDCFDYKLV